MEERASSDRQPATVTWSEIRHGIVFGLGCIVILDALVSAGNPWPELGIGAVMVGILPLDRVVMGMRADRGRGRVRRGIHPRDKMDDE